MWCASSFLRLFWVAFLLMMVVSCGVNASPVTAPKNSTGLTAAELSKPFYSTPMVYNLTLPSAPADNATAVSSSAFSHGAEAGVDAVAGWPKTLYCNDGTRWVEADAGPIKSGITYLRHHQSPCGAYARSCSRISCSYNSAIYLCNDNYNEINISCNDAATFAQIIVNTCLYWNQYNEDVVAGQQFNSDNWNIIIHADRC